MECVAVKKVEIHERTRSYWIVSSLGIKKKLSQNLLVDPTF